MDKWSDLKPLLKDLLAIIKTIGKSVFQLSSKSYIKNVNASPLKAVLIHSIVVFFIMLCISLYWFAEYRSLKNNMDKQSYNLMEKIDSAYNVGEMEGINETKESNQAQIDSLNNIVKNQPKHVQKRFKRHHSTNYPQEQKQVSTTPINSVPDNPITQE